MTISETIASTIPGMLCSGALFLARSNTASQATYRARARKHAPTILRVSLSFRSRFTMSASTDMRQSSVAPDVTSMKLSIPKPTSEMLPASAPATIPTKPSRLFQIIVKHSRRFPRSAALSRKVGMSFMDRTSVARSSFTREIKLADCNKQAAADA